MEEKMDDVKKEPAEFDNSRSTYYDEINQDNSSYVKEETDPNFVHCPTIKNEPWEKMDDVKKEPAEFDSTCSTYGEINQTNSLHEGAQTQFVQCHDIKKEPWDETENAEINYSASAHYYNLDQDNASYVKEETDPHFVGCPDIKKEQEAVVVSLSKREFLMSCGNSLDSFPKHLRIDGRACAEKLNRTLSEETPLEEQDNMLCCDVCNKMFNTIRSLERHMEVHTAEKQYVSNMLDELAASNEGGLPTEHGDMIIPDITEMTGACPKSVENNIEFISPRAVIENCTVGCKKNMDVLGENVNKEIDGDFGKKKYTRSDNKQLRLHGKKYEGQKKDGNAYKIIERQERKLLPKTCSHIERLVSDRSFMCHTVEENVRKIVHRTVWNFNTWEDKKVYINGLVEIRPVMRRRKGKDSSFKQYGYDYFLPLGNGSKVRVCRDFFLSTTGLKQTLVNNWIKDFNKIINGNVSSSEEYESEVMENRKRKAPKKQKLLKSDSVNRWLELIPKIHCHYCSASSSRVYVDSEFRSLNHMHHIYKEWCEKTGNEYVQRKKFCEILEKQKISIHKPTKDQCDSFIAEGNLKEEA